MEWVTFARSVKDNEMARLAKIKTNEKKKALVAKYAARRAALKETLRSASASDAQKAEAFRALAALPRSSSPTRVRNRCAITGRPRAVYRKFGLCRNAFRELALRGDIPGVTKASW